MTKVSIKTKSGNKGIHYGHYDIKSDPHAKIMLNKVTANNYTFTLHVL